jgi:hypothetical protein
MAEAAKVADLGTQPGCGQGVDPAQTPQSPRRLRPGRERQLLGDLALEL